MASICLFRFRGYVPPDAAQRAALRRGALLIRGPSLCASTWLPALRSIVKNAAPRPGHDFMSWSQRQIDGLVVFSFEPRDQFGGGQDLADAADALAAAPDFLPGFWLGALPRRVGTETHFRRIR